MEKEEILNENFTEKEIINQKSHKKIKIFLSITSSILVIATIVILIGYFKFNLFKKEIYNLDIQISRNTHEVSYFTETKILETRLGLTSGESDNKTITIKNNFLVLLTNREKLEYNTFLNTASLIILDVKIIIENEEKQGISFNIFDEEIIKEFKSNPESSKYPMAIFSFYENGTITDINLPKNMNQSIAKSMIDIIEKIIPKLSRNRTEDFNNGLQINIKKNNDIKTLVENQSKGEIKNIKKSKFTKYIERDIENGQLTSIRTNSTISLETQADQEESTFGFKDYYSQEKSKIILNEIKNEEEIFELIQILSKYYNFISSQDLLKSFEKKENKKKEYISKDLEKDINNSSSKVRKLDNYAFDGTFTVKKFNVLGIKGEIKIHFRIRTLLKFLKNCEAEIIISTDNGESTFGSMVPLTLSKTFETPEIVIFYTIFPNFVFAGVGINGKGTLTISAVYQNKNIEVSIVGKIKANAYIWAISWVAELSGGAWGTLVEIGGGVSVNFDGQCSLFGHIGGGEIIVYIQGKLFHFIPGFYYEWKVFDGWKRDF